MKKTLFSLLLGTAAFCYSVAADDHDHPHLPIERWTAGHGDIGIGYDEGVLALHIHVDPGAVINGTALTEGRFLAPEEARVIVSEKNKKSAPEALAAGTGVPAGEPLWELPGIQVSKVPFFGFAAEELDPAAWPSSLRFNLQQVVSPSGEGHFSVYSSDGLGGVSFLMSTAEGGITEADHVPINAGGHDHFFMTFSERGTWKITLTGTGMHSTAGELTTEPVTFIFEVDEKPLRWTSGHGDIGVAFHEDHLDLHLHLHEGAILDGVALVEDVEPAPASTHILVSNAAQTIATEELAVGTGVSSGESLWILPASNHAGLPFLGLGTEELNPEEWSGDIRLSLVDVDSPSGAGHFAAYQSDGLGGLTFAMSTSQEGITADDHADLTVGGHDHYAFAFSEAGVWHVTFMATGTHATAGVLTSEAVTYTFVVGGSSPGVISLGQDHYVADQGDEVVMVQVVRSDASQHAEVTLTASDGAEVKSNPPSASAIADRDYVAPVGEDTHVHFEVGEFSKSVPLSLLSPAKPVTQNRHFVVSLSHPENGATLGERTTATVRILAPDARKPSLSLSSPGGKVSTALPLIVSGKAGDAMGLERVEIILNDEEPVLAELDDLAKPTSVPFHALIHPLQGSNTLIVTAYDLSGNSTQITRAFTFDKRHRVSLLRSFSETLNTTGDMVGTLSLKSLPSSAASALTPKDSEADLKTSDVQAGVPVTLTATAKKGYTFSHWIGLPAGAAEAGLTASFTMTSADVSVQAVFIENPFAGNADVAAGTGFQGLLLPVVGTPRSHATTGFLMGTLNASSGAFTGQVTVNGLLTRFVATFNGNGRSFFKVGRSQLPTLSFGDYELRLQYVTSSSGDHVSMTLVHENSTSSGMAMRGRYGRSKRVPVELLNSASRGFYTLVIPAKAQTPPIATSLFPQGTSFATLTLDAYGSFRYSGTLADGMKVTGSSLLVEGDHAYLFVLLTTPGQPAKVKGGSFGGALTFDPAQTNSDVSGTDLFWYRPTVAQVDRPASAATATSLYTEGWPQGLTMSAVGALYDTKMTIQNALNLSAEDGNQGNAALVLDHGKLSEEAAYVMNIVGNAVKKLTSANKSYTLKLKTSTGSFSGTFTPDWASPSKKVPAFQGIILQKGMSRGGYGFFISNAEGDRDPESGLTTLGIPSISVE